MNRRAGRAGPNQKRRISRFRFQLQLRLLPELMICRALGAETAEL